MFIIFVLLVPASLLAPSCCSLLSSSSFYWCQPFFLAPSLLFFIIIILILLVSAFFSCSILFFFLIIILVSIFSVSAFSLAPSQSLLINCTVTASIPPPFRYLECQDAKGIDRRLYLIDKCNIWIIHWKCTSNTLR